MLAFVEQQIAARFQRFPVGEFARLYAQFFAVFGIVCILTMDAIAAFAIGFEKGLKFLEVIAFGAKPGKVAATAARFVKQCGELPLGIAPEPIAMNNGRLNVQAPENEFERMTDRRQAGTGRSGDGDNGMLL